MAEIFSWPEGTVYFWTGTATASALVAYAQNTRVTLAHGYENYQTLDGNYHDNHTGQIATVQVGMLFVVNNSALRTFFDAKTAVHAHFRHAYNNGSNVSAGHLLYSGRIDSMSFLGREGQTYVAQMAYHANEWTAYG